MKQWKQIGKRCMALLMAVVLVGGLLSGCGKSQSGSNGSGSDGSDGPIKLVLWSTYGTYGTQYLNTLIEKFNDSQDEYVLESSSGSDASTIRSKMQSSKVENYPSLICGTSTTMTAYAEADYVAPIQQFMDADSEDWNAGMFDVVRYAYSDQEGKMIGYPVGVSCNGYLVNVDLLKEAGYTLEDLTSFEKIVEAATAAVNKKICKYGLAFYDGVDVLDMLTMQGVDIVDGGNGYTGEVTKSLLLEGESNAALTKAVNLIAKMYQDGVALDYGYGSDCSSIFKANDLLFWKCTNSSTHNVFTANSGIDWAFIPSVGVDENAEFKGSALSEGTGIFICNTGDEKEMQGAYEFIKFLSQPENQNYFEQGIGYLPYTKEAAEQYMEWAKENFPSAEKLLNMLSNSPKELQLPYVAVGGEINLAFADLLGTISVSPKGDVNTYIEDASSAIDAALKIYEMRKENQ
ncbi:MAG: extracellular solute-binding protein [Tyzzerella sp.]|nr:extracellular solute-binding protein [Tyzzerella sp.]